MEQTRHLRAIGGNEARRNNAAVAEFRPSILVRCCPLSTATSKTPSVSMRSSAWKTRSRLKASVRPTRTSGTHSHVPFLTILNPSPYMDLRYDYDEIIEAIEDSFGVEVTLHCDADHHLTEVGPLIH